MRSKGRPLLRGAVRAALSTHDELRPADYRVPRVCHDVSELLTRAAWTGLVRPRSRTGG
jgi:hypothetical protein